MKKKLKKSKNKINYNSKKCYCLRKMKDRKSKKNLGKRKKLRKMKKKKRNRQDLNNQEKKKRDKLLKGLRRQKN